MSELWSKKCRELVPYVAGEQPRGRTFIKLNTNENPYPPSPKVLEALRETAGEELRLYPDPGCTALRETVAQVFGVDPGQVFVGNGSDEVLAMAFRAFFDEERPVRFPDVTYSFYPVYCDLYDIPYELVPLREDFSVPVEPFLTPCGGVVLAQPNAPTGRAMALEDLERIAAAHPDRAVVVDEAYVDFGAETALPLVHRYSNLLVVRTFSKSGSLAGLRVGYAIGSRTLIEGLERVRDSFNSYPVDRLAQAGARAALLDGAYYREITGQIVETREKTAAALRELGFTVQDSKANFLFVSYPGVAGKTLLDGLRQRGILVRWWGKPRIDQWLRITVGTDSDMEALVRALGELVGR